MRNVKRNIHQIIYMISFLVMSQKANANQFPLPLRGCANDAPCYVTAYYNHSNDQFPGRDWNNGTRTYSTQLSNGNWYHHRGTDFATGGSSGRVIINARRGMVRTVVSTCRSDNCRGGCCACRDNQTRNGLGNFIEVCRILENGDADPDNCELYGHMRFNSARVRVGDIVECGAELGEVGSSGCSTGPHLHFEVHVSGDHIDPFHGVNSPHPSMWIDQGEYDSIEDRLYDSTLLPGGTCEGCAPPGGRTPADDSKNVVTSLTLDWQIPTCILNNIQLPAEAYRVQVNMRNSFPEECETNDCVNVGLLVINKGVQQTQYEIPEGVLVPDMTYHWRVRAGRSGLGGSWSDTWSFTTKAADVPMCMPQPETCNNRDDNCNGQVDENLTASCPGSACPQNMGTKICNNGSWSACTSGKNSCGVCNNTRPCGCNGNGIETCTNGAWANCNKLPCAMCVPQAELCNNKDDNCNGNIDENLIEACIGECGAGQRIRNMGSWSNCTNNKNSCGTCSNTKSCNNACGPGTATCSNGNWINCTAPLGQAEVCNNKDDDCDGLIDNNLTRICSFGCGNGIEACANGAWVNCNAPKCQLPAPSLTSPADNIITNQTARLSWSPVQGATQYGYVIMEGASGETGAILKQGTTASTFYSYLAHPEVNFGMRIKWKVRAVDGNGVPGTWSSIRSFFYSHTYGELLRCNDGDCPKANTVYMIDKTIYAGGVGVPDRLNIEWVSGNCPLIGQGSRLVTGLQLSRYHPSAAWGGCPQ